MSFSCKLLLELKYYSIRHTTSPLVANPALKYEISARQSSTAKEKLVTPLQYALPVPALSLCKAAARQVQSPYFGYISVTHKLHFIYRLDLFQFIFDLFLLYWNRMKIG